MAESVIAVPFHYIFSSNWAHLTARHGPNARIVRLLSQTLN
jgi:hypothetical protein